MAEVSFSDASSHNKTLISNANTNQEYLVMTVEIGDGRTDIITIREEDDPSILAGEFAAKHNLDLSLQKSLSKLIRQNKDFAEKKDSEADIDNWSDWPGSNFQSQNYMNFDSFTPKINEKSRKLMEKCERKGSVYERLYQKGKKTNETKETIKTLDVTNKSRSSNNINYGEWLYVKGIKMKEAIKKTSEEKKKEQAEKDSKELTFSPIINKQSSLMSPRYYEKPEEVLLRKAEVSKHKIEVLKQKLEQEKLKECKFMPHINPGTRVRDSQKTIHEDLYDQAERTKEKMLQKRENELKQYSFAPDVALTKKKDPNQEPVYERLLSSRKKFESDLEDLRKSRVSECDETTGQKLFRPVTESRIEPRTQPVWDYLYSKDSEKKKEREEALSQEQRFWEANASAQRTSENTQRIFQDFRDKQYEKLFHLMDSDSDGRISANSIGLEGLDARALEILKPLFEEMEVSDKEMGLREFLMRVEALAKGLNVDDRAHLMRRETKATEEEPERAPYVSQTSAKLAAKKRQELSNDIYERLVNASKITEMRTKKHKELQEIFELKDCTFKPNLTKN